jgi:hypothetical protein
LILQIIILCVLLYCLMVYCLLARSCLGVRAALLFLGFVWPCRSPPQQRSCKTRKRGRTPAPQGRRRQAARPPARGCRRQAPQDRRGLTFFGEGGLRQRGAACGHWNRCWMDALRAPAARPGTRHFRAEHVAGRARSGGERGASHPLGPRGPRGWDFRGRGLCHSAPFQGKRPGWAICPPWPAPLALPRY